MGNEGWGKEGRKERRHALITSDRLFAREPLRFVQFEIAVSRSMFSQMEGNFLACLAREISFPSAARLDKARLAALPPSSVYHSIAILLEKKETSTFPHSVNARRHLINFISLFSCVFLFLCEADKRNRDIFFRKMEVIFVNNSEKRE